MTDDQPHLSPRERVVSYLLNHPWLLSFFGDFIWAWLGLVTFLAGLQFFLDPSYIAKTALGRNLAGGVEVFGLQVGLDEAWNITWTGGGLLLAWGVIRRVPRTQLIGLELLTAAMFINTLAVGVDVGLSPSFVILATVTLACLLRAVYVALAAPTRAPR